MVNTIHIILFTLIVYSMLSVTLYFLFDEKEEIVTVFGFGIVGIVLSLIFKIISKIKFLLFRINKRTIVENVKTKQRYKCKTKHCEDIRYCISDYKIIKKYAAKNEYNKLQDLPKQIID